MAYVFQRTLATLRSYGIIYLGTLNQYKHGLCISSAFFILPMVIVMIKRLISKLHKFYIVFIILIHPYFTLNVLSWE